MYINYNADRTLVKYNLLCLFGLKPIVAYGYNFRMFWSVFIKHYFRVKNTIVFKDLLILFYFYIFQSCILNTHNINI